MFSKSIKNIAKKKGSESKNTNNQRVPMANSLII